MIRHFFAARFLERIIILSFLLSLGACIPLAYSQMIPDYSDVRLQRMPYSNSGGEQGLTTYFYSRDGVLRSALWNLLDSTRYSINYHIYDSAGRETGKYREFSDSLTSSEIYEYDESGHRIKEIFKRSDGVEGTAVFHRDDVGRLVSTDCDRYKGWFTGRIVYQYVNGRRTNADLYKGEQRIGIISYTYDKSDYLIRECWDFNGQFTQTFTYEYEPVPGRIYTFSSPFVSINGNFRVISENYDYNNESGGPSFYTYNKNGKLIKKVFERSDGLRTVTVYQYNDIGNLTTSHRKYHNGQTADFTYVFDKARRLIERSFNRSDGAEGFEKYSYDQYGRLEKGVYKNMDFWLNGSLTFNYDGWGHLKTGHFKGEDGFDAELEFTADSYGNVLKMHWIFSFGQTQTYTFTYGPISFLR